MYHSPKKGGPCGGGNGNCLPITEVCCIQHFVATLGAKERQKRKVEGSIGEIEEIEENISTKDSKSSKKEKITAGVLELGMSRMSWALKLGMAWLEPNW
jgi:hypothetical protein